MSEKWIVIGISGVTCGGKTTLATALKKFLPSCEVIMQDDYFFKENDPRHTWIEELNHVNYDILSSLDMSKMYQDIVKILQVKNGYQKHIVAKEEDNTKINSFDVRETVLARIKESKIKVLIIEGFSILNDPSIANQCDLKYFFTLKKEDCYERRLTRTYDPPDCPGYFEKCVWPEYLKQLDHVRKNVANVKYLNGICENPFEDVLHDLLYLL